MITDRQTIGTTDDKADLFNLLLKANSEFGVNSPMSLTDEELLGNLFTFILGGHEVHFVCRRHVRLFTTH